MSLVAKVRLNLGGGVVKGFNPSKSFYNKKRFPVDLWQLSHCCNHALAYTTLAVPQLEVDDRRASSQSLAANMQTHPNNCQPIVFHKSAHLHKSVHLATLATPVFSKVQHFWNFRNFSRVQKVAQEGQAAGWRTDGRTYDQSEERTDERTDGRSVGRTVSPGTHMSKDSGAYT